MNRIVLGALAALLFVGSGLFWMQGRAEIEQGEMPPVLEMLNEKPIDSDLLPFSDVDGLIGPSLPEATEQSREQKRFNRYDRDRDGRITRNELLSTRSAAFRKLDVDGNNLLSFEEWAIRTVNKFGKADANGNLELTTDEFMTTRPKKSKKPKCRC